MHSHKIFIVILYKSWIEITITTHVATSKDKIMTPHRPEYETNDNFPTVSIVIVNRNGYKWLKSFFPSIINTNYPKFEIIVVDNGSTDQSIEYLGSYQDNLVRVISFKDNLGFAEASNAGIKEANGEIIGFLNNDIQVDENWLMAAVEKLLSQHKAGAVQSKMMQYHQENKIDCIGLSVDKFGIHVPIGYDEVDSGQYDGLDEIGACCGGAMIVWKKVLNKVGFFDTKYFLYYEDVDLSWRIRLSGYKILPAPSSLVYHVGSATSKNVPSAFVTFHITKNHIASWLKNSKLSTLIFYWPVLLFIIAAYSLFDIVYGRYGHATAYFKAIMWVLFHINYILKERYKIQHTIRKPEVNPDNILFIGNKDNTSSSNLSIRVKKGIYLIRRKLSKT
jgi:GT2 family glycosyltransferase